MADTASVRIVKEFTYRGAVRTFSNRYHIGTNNPPDSAHWTTLMDAIVAAEKLIYNPTSTGGCKITQGIGYAAGSEVPVFSKNYTQEGVGAFSGGVQTPGDVAMLVRYSTPDRSTKNHPVYCFNYYHAMISQGGNTTGDLPHSAQKSALATYGAAWLTGFSDGVTTFKRSRPTGDLCNGVLVPTYFTHRDLPH